MYMVHIRAIRDRTSGGLDATPHLVPFIHQIGRPIAWCSMYGCGDRDVGAMHSTAYAGLSLY